MSSTCTLGILSDIHYASSAEQARGDNYENAGIPNPLLRFSVSMYRRFFWLYQPLQKNYLLDKFLQQIGAVDYLVANGDYSCDSMFVGVSDPAVLQSVCQCLDRLRARFGDRLRVNFGDHELGKVSFFGGHGGMRLASWQTAQEKLGLRPFWQLKIGRYVLIGVVSSLVALPVFRTDALAEEVPQWERLRASHLAEINQAFASLVPDQRVLLFCHDPTALPFLAQLAEVRARMPQIEQTIIGHLHSDLILWKSRWLSGMPRINFLGHTARRLSTALSQGREWKPFHVRLCPSLAGIELLKDGGYLTIELDPEGARPLVFHRHRLPR
jgi:hypothetical protein